MSEPNLPTQFGIFYPIGYIVAAFPQQEAAQQVQRDFVHGRVRSNGLQACHKRTGDPRGTEPSWKCWLVGDIG